MTRFLKEKGQENDGEKEQQQAHYPFGIDLRGKKDSFYLNEEQCFCYETQDYNRV